MAFQITVLFSVSDAETVVS